MVYLGQTGVTIRTRVRQLRGIVTDSEMPYSDPHTAAPALWALLRETRIPYEVSACPVDGHDQWRKGLECAAIALYRQGQSESPRFNFGRMPTGHSKSSGNNARLRELGKRFRGGPIHSREQSHLTGVTPVGSLSGAPENEEWCGHRWSSWVALAHANAPSETGLYRLRGMSNDGLVYIGQGFIRARLRQHFRRSGDSGHRQGSAFADSMPLECSWVVGESWLPHQRLELETDLIGAYVLHASRAPTAQFLG